MKQQRGISLVELLVGLAVSIFVLAGAGTAFLAHNVSVLNNLRADKLNHDIQVVTDIMVNDLRRAGYWNSSAPGANLAQPNPFRNIFLVNNNCVLYAYDNRNAANDAVPDGQVQNAERMGFKILNNAIWMKTAGDLASATDCTQGDWTRVTNPDLVTVNNLNLALNARCITLDTNPIGELATPCAGVAGRTVEVRRIDIGVAATLIADNASQKQVIGSARVRNNAIVAN
ncbi:prepilin-type N-terminal cleavage/methylation domain-containing protein [Aquabacterium sp. A08]|uniref:prepilin-type N-terminal cleavage/methylation domain-containing protein n=1 Tax=Aquabacterium sp. A08 TaxID=2718532 RepID=UPI00141FB1ED|nr:prepilin-type N-terminal cleavage/methylation domain-containing protein [Aquabacterium sp. A08]NIC41501.1 hypothetical protein [Aquabacterium sp. A08]